MYLLFYTKCNVLPTVSCNHNLSLCFFCNYNSVCKITFIGYKIYFRIDYKLLNVLLDIIYITYCLSKL